MGFITRGFISYWASLIGGLYGISLSYCASLIWDIPTSLGFIIRGLYGIYPYLIGLHVWGPKGVSTATFAPGPHSGGVPADLLHCFWATPRLPQVRTIKAGAVDRFGRWFPKARIYKLKESRFFFQRALKVNIGHGTPTLITLNPKPPKP